MLLVLADSAALLVARTRRRRQAGADLSQLRRKCRIAE
jgi:hypothetical protein